MEAGDYLRQFMKDANITQVELAKALGVTQPAVADWVNGRRPVPLERVVQLKKLYGMDPIQLRPELRELI